MSKKALIEGFIELEVRDKNGKLIEKRIERSHSFVKNFLAALRTIFFLNAIINGNMSPSEEIDTNGNPRKQTTGFTHNDWGIFDLVKSLGSTKAGIVVGSGTTTPTPNDYKLASPIADGTGAGQLQYGTIDSPDISCDGNTCKLIIIRTFTNGSGGDVTVTEIGLQAQRYYGSTEYMILIARDVLSQSVTVPNGATLTVRYIIQITT